MKILEYFSTRLKVKLSDSHLLLACQNSNLEIISHLLNHGCSPNTEIILTSLNDAQITRKLLEFSHLSRLGCSCLLRAALDSGYKESFNSLIDYCKITFTDLWFLSLKS